MEDDTTRTETDEIAGEDVVIERTVEYNDRGAIVTLNIESKGTDPTTFTLVDEFSDDLPVANAAFRPGTDPDGSRIGPNGVSFEEVIEPDEERTVVYALKFFEPTPDAELDALEIIEDEPRREESQVGTRIVPRRGTMPIAPSSSSHSDAESSPPRSDVESVPSPSDEGSPSSRSGDDEGTIGATLGLFAGDKRSSRRSWTTDGGVSGREPITSSEAEETTDPGSLTVTADPTIERNRRRYTSAGRGELNGSATDVSTPADAGDGVVSTLVTELREGSVEAEELAALRRELGVERTLSDDARIGHLQSRMGELAAYTDALRTVIDEHGTPEEFVNRLEDRIDGLRSDLDSVESELSATRDAVERLERRVESEESLREEFASVFDGLGDDSA